MQPCGRPDAELLARVVAACSDSGLSSAAEPDTLGFPVDSLVLPDAVLLREPEAVGLRRQRVVSISVRELAHLRISQRTRQQLAIYSRGHRVSASPRTERIGSTAPGRAHPGCPDRPLQCR